MPRCHVFAFSRAFFALLRVCVFVFFVLVLLGFVGRCHVFVFLCFLCWFLLGVVVCLCFCVGAVLGVVLAVSGGGCVGRVNCVRAVLIVSVVLGFVFVVSGRINRVLIVSAAADRVNHVRGMSVTSGACQSRQDKIACQSCPARSRHVCRARPSPSNQNMEHGPPPYPQAPQEKHAPRHEQPLPKPSPTSKNKKNKQKNKKTRKT